MKKILLITLYSLFIIPYSFGQGGTWTWISGDSLTGALGVSGTQGVPSVNNYPTAKYGPCEWKDKQGNFWIYGGDAEFGYPNSDLWKYNPVTNEWTWVKGKLIAYDLPVYGTKGVANPANTPGAIAYGADTWVDTSGNFWLYGGIGINYFKLPQSVLWKYEISSNQWTWVNGDTVGGAKAVHGTQGIASYANTPGARQEGCSAWTDTLNNVWLFGGYGYDENDDPGCLNDLWKYNISTNEWTWMKGSAFINASVNYGAKGIPDVNNDPGARGSYPKWKDRQGNFWVMGGWYNSNCFNDVWKYDVSNNQWTWMSGTDINNDPGNYQATCVFDTINVPYSRYEQRASVTDNCGMFWMFGGYNYAIEYLNDLWIFDSQQLKWKWVSGSNIPDQAGSYGTRGVPAPSNMPPSRRGAVAWWGNDNKFYMFGGLQGDLYTDVWVFNPDTNCIPVCGAVTALPPVADFQSNKTTICANDCINFTDLSANATSWQWSFAGGSPATSSDKNPRNVCYTMAGTYSVTLIVSNSGGRDSLTLTNYIKVIVAPQAPSILQQHDTLFFNSNPAYSYYQWYLDSTIINGATDTLLIITHGGNYNVKISDENGCSIAAGIAVGIKEVSQSNYISLSPNPVKDKLYVISYTLYGSAEIIIYNTLGEVCRQYEIKNPKSEIDVSLLSPGIYFVQIASDAERWTGKFVKE